MPRYPFPPLPDPAPPFPPDDPLDTPIGQLSGLWIEPQCTCGRASGPYPLRLLAAEQGWRVKLGDVLPRLKCKYCGERPTAVGLTDDIQHGAPRVTDAVEPPRRIVMLAVRGAA